MQRTWLLACTVVCVLIAPPTGWTQTGLAANHVEQSKVERRGFAKIVHCRPVRNLVLGAVLTGLAFPLDNGIRSELTEHPTHELVWTDVGNGYGNGLFLGATALTTTGIGLAIGSDDLRTTGVTLIKGVAIELTTVAILKNVISRQRPDSTDYESFPSGHSSGAFTVSTILARRYGWRIAIPAYALAMTTAYARMEDNRHFLSDVVAGAAIGFTVGELVSMRPERRNGSIVPVIGRSGIGILIQF